MRCQRRGLRRLTHCAQNACGRSHSTAAMKHRCLQRCCAGCRHHQQTPLCPRGAAALRFRVAGACALHAPPPSFPVRTRIRVYVRCEWTRFEADWCRDGRERGDLVIRCRYGSAGHISRRRTKSHTANSNPGSEYACGGGLMKLPRLRRRSDLCCWALPRHASSSVLGCPALRSQCS
jgi:hypothetical protein